MLIPKHHCESCGGVTPYEEFCEECGVTLYLRSFRVTCPHCSYRQTFWKRDSIILRGLFVCPDCDGEFYPDESTTKFLGENHENQ